jgi:Na+-transporting methylmalonyl-CoA/oxaloacetate decarboxylase gamma subunit
VTVSAVEGEPEPSVENSELSQDENPELSHDENPELSQDERAELERLRAETAELHQGNGQAGKGKARRHFSWRTPVSIVLIVLGCILALVAVLGVWAGEEVSNTDRWVATVEPLIHDPAIQNVLTDKITDQVTSQLNLTGTINQAAAQLNSKGLTRISSLLTTFGPQIASAVTGFIHSTVHSVISSPQAARIWVQVNTVAHQGLVKVLSGQGNGAVSVKNGQIVLNLGPFIAVVKQDLIAHGFKLASNIPPVSPTLALFQANDLGKAQSLYRLITTLRWVLPILALVFLAAGVWVARNRRRALVGAGLGLAASMLLLGIGLLIGRSIYLSSVPSSVLPADAAAAGWDAFVHFIKESLRVVLLVGLVVAIGAFFTGPSRAAVQTRSGIKSGLEWVRHYGERRGVSTGPVGQWTYLHRRGLRIGAVALFALILLFWGEPTGLVVIVLVILLLVVLGLIELIGRPVAEPESASQTPESASQTSESATQT